MVRPESTLDALDRALTLTILALQRLRLALDRVEPMLLFDPLGLQPADGNGRRVQFLLVQSEKARE